MLHEIPMMISRDARVDAMIADLLNAEDSTTDAVCSLLAVVTALTLRMTPIRRHAMAEVLRNAADAAARGCVDCELN